jgi:WD40 repeat protein
MTCSLLKIPAFSAERIDHAYICEARKLVVVTSPDQKVSVYAFQDWSADPKLIREYKNHAGAILAGAFAPLKYNAYFITVGYDKSLFLYNLDDGKQPDAIFSFTQENQEIGYFTSVTFVPVDKSRLVFAAGTSTGHVVVFDSQANFEPKTHAIFTSAIKSVSGNSAGEIAVAAAGAPPKLVFDFDFENASELSDNGQNLASTFQVRLTSPIEEHEPVRLATICEDQSVGLWEVESSLRMAKPVQTVELGTNIIAAHWNLGSFSLSAICGKKEDKLSDLKGFRISRLGSADEGEWKAYPLEIKNE